MKAKTKKKPERSFLGCGDFWQAVDDCITPEYFQNPFLPASKGLLFKSLDALKKMAVFTGYESIEALIVVPNVMTLSKAESILSRMTRSIVGFVRANNDLAPKVQILCKQPEFFGLNGSRIDNRLGNKALLVIHFTSCVRGSQRVRGRQDASCAVSA